MTYRMVALNASGEMLRLTADIDSLELVEGLTVREAYKMMETHRSGFRFDHDADNRKPIRNRIHSFRLIHSNGHVEIFTR